MTEATREENGRSPEAARTPPDLVGAFVRLVRMSERMLAEAQFFETAGEYTLAEEGPLRELRDFRLEDLAQLGLMQFNECVQMHKSWRGRSSDAAENALAAAAATHLSIGTIALALLGPPAPDHLRELVPTLQEARNAILTIAYKLHDSFSDVGTLRAWQAEVATRAEASP
ncbi:MAG TPA: hypothetical protein VMM83_08235 [Longimicrobiales bacterium]|nr:hypothetical protein [Longimicrobiales bacterium]